MRKHTLLILLSAAIMVLSGCGGGEEPTPTPAPQPTFTPTVAATATPAPTDTPTALPTEVPTVAPTEAPTEVPTVAAVPAPESPLAAPVSPLPVPVEAAAPPPTPAVPAAEQMAGSWQLESIQLGGSSTTTVTPPSLYRLAVWRSGAAAILADCNTGSGRLVPGDGMAITLDVNTGTATCAADSLGGSFARALAATTAFTMAEGRLGLYYGDGTNQLRFVPVPPTSSTNPNALAWSRLQNTTYTVEGTPAGDNQAPLINGRFVAQPLPGATGDFVVNLSPLRANGPLDDDELADLAVVLHVDRGNGVMESYLNPVLNIGMGLPLPLRSELLGTGVALRDLAIRDRQITVDFDRQSAGGVVESLRWTFTLEGDTLVKQGEETLPQAAAPVATAPIDVMLTPGGAPVVLTGTLPFSGTADLRIAGQPVPQVTVEVASPYDDVWLAIRDEAGTVTLRALAAESSSWTGALPTPGSYIVTLAAMGSATPYTVTVR